MSLTQFVKFHNLVQIVEAFCGTHQPVRFRTLSRDSEGFSGAVVLQVVVQARDGTPEKEFCLRGWPPESLPRERLLGLHRLLDHIHRCGVQAVPVPLRSQFGSTIYTEAGQFWQLEPWQPGRADFWSNPNDQRLQNTMTMLAQWHEAASRFEARPSESAWFKQTPSATSPTVLDRLERIQRFRAGDSQALRQRIEPISALDHWQGDSVELRELARQILDLFDRSAVSINDELETYRDTRFRLHPCLRDVWHDHVLFQGDAVSGLIDPSAAKSETPATDLARLLGSFLADDDSRWDRALEAYRTARPLSDVEARLARTLDRSTALLSGMTWLERLFVQRQTYSNPSRIMDRLRQTAARLERLAAPNNIFC